MLSIFKKPKRTDLSWMGVDMHSHLLPGIDDGSPDVETSITCINGLRELGLHSFIATPHIYSEIHPNTPETIAPSYQKLRAALDANGHADVRLEAAAEYMIDDKFTSYYEGEQKLLRITGEEVLIEMSYQFERKDILEQVFQLQLHGYQPILAHPERYIYYHATPKTYARLKERGCLFQVNLLSLSGYYGEPVRNVARQLVKEKMIDYVGTDLHHEKHLRYIEKFVTTVDVEKLLQGNVIRNLNL